MYRICLVLKVFVFSLVFNNAPVAASLDEDLPWRSDWWVLPS